MLNTQTARPPRIAVRFIKESFRSFYCRSSESNKDERDSINPARIAL